MCRLCPPIAKSHAHYRPAVPTGTARRSAECPDGGIGRRAGLKHQWSNPCRFDPGSGYPLNRKSLIFKDLRFFFWILHHICTTKICRLPESRRVSSAFLSENCSRYPHFLGYQEQFRYVFALGLLRIGEGYNLYPARKIRNLNYFIGYSQIESSHPIIDAAILCSAI